MIVAEEVGPKCGTPHLQGAIIFSSVTSIRRLRGRKDRLGKFFWRIMFAEPKNNRVYCSGGRDGNKEGFVRVALERGTCPMSREEQGEFGKESERERHRRAIEAAREQRFDDIDADIYLRCHGTLKRIAHEAKPLPKEAKVVGMFLFGDSRTGKSRFARSYCRELGIEYYRKDWSRWWDNYNNEEAVIMEEANEHSCANRMNDLKEWCDRYACQVQVKGSHIYMRAKVFIITSNHPFDVCFPNSRDRAALRERFKVIYFKNHPDDRVPMDVDDYIYALDLWNEGQRFGNEKVEVEELPFDFTNVLNPVRKEVVIPAPQVPEVLQDDDGETYEYSFDSQLRGLPDVQEDSLLNLFDMEQEDSYL